MGLKIGGVFISVCNDHRLYADEEITFVDIIRAEELLERANQIAGKARNKEQTAGVTDKDLTEAVKKILKD